jgi:hypothetical protein
MPKPSKITKIAPQIHFKSTKNRGCVADAFWKRFGTRLDLKREVPKHHYLVAFCGKIRKICHWKFIQKSIAKEHGKWHEKATEIDAKIH